MKIVIFRFVLVQIILLLNSYSNHYVQANQNCNSSSVLLENFMISGDRVNDYHSSVSNIEESFKIDIAEIEEDKDKFISLGKYLTGKKSFVYLIPDLIPGHFFGHIKECESIAYFIEELSSNRSYITFRVFRI